MLDSTALLRALSEYARTIPIDYDIGEVLHRLTDHIAEVLGADGAGVSVVDNDGRLRFVTATDERVVRVEERQISLAEGPCHTAFETGKPVVAEDLDHEDRWPAYTPDARRIGCRAVLGLPMHVDDERIGAVDVYFLDPREWSEDEIEAGQVLAAIATGYILNARRLAETLDLAEQLQHALDSRVIIEQAKGIIAERHGIDLPRAFDRLRSHARSQRVPLHDVAQRVVNDTLDV